MRIFFLESVPVSSMIVKQGIHFTTEKIVKNVCKTLFVTVTIFSPNLLTNDCCFKIIVDTRTITENVHMTKVTFLHHFCRWALTFPIQIIEHIALFALLTWRYVITSTLKRHWNYLIWQTVQRCINMGRPFYHVKPPEAWRHHVVPHGTIYLAFCAAGNSAGSLTPKSGTAKNHSFPHITRCSNLRMWRHNVMSHEIECVTRRSGSAVAPNTTDS